MIKSITLLLSFIGISVSIMGQDYVVSTKIIGNRIKVKIIPKTLETFEAYRYEGLSCEIGSSEVFQLKPADKAAWEKAAIESPRSKAAYSILTKKHKIDTESPLEERIQAGRQLSNSHAFYTILTCSDPTASELSGLSFTIPKTDNKVELHIKNSINPIRNTTVVIDPLSINNLSSSPDIVGFNFDHAVKIAWDHEEHMEHVVAYVIQRKDYGNSFKDLDIPPKIYTYQENEDPLIEYQMLHVDSLEMNYNNYSYRIIGMDAWGERMKPSNELTLHGRDLTPPKRPNNFTVKYINETAELSWSKVETDVDRMLVLRSENGEQGPFEQISDIFLTNNSTSFTDKISNVENVYYYMLLAADTAGNVSQTYPEYLNIPDIYPPNPPLDLRAKIDSIGNVILYWHHSDNNDIRGYKVFRSDDQRQSFIQVSKGTTKDNVFYDQLSLNNNNPKVFYYVKALDKSFNNSIPSDTITILRPDTISPSAPILRRAVIDNNKVNLAWIPSSSKDVSLYVIKADSGSGWWEYGRTEANVNQFSQAHDTSIKEMSFKVSAVDEVGNSSEDEATRKVILKVDAPQAFSFELSSGQGKVSIQWQNAENIQSVMIYRALKDQPFRLVKKAKTSEQLYTDKTVIPGEKYQYKIAQELANGTRSSLSEFQEIRVK